LRRITYPALFGTPWAARPSARHAPGGLGIHAPTDAGAIRAVPQARQDAPVGRRTPRAPPMHRDHANENFPTTSGVNLTSRAFCASIPIVSDAATAPVEAVHPDPDRAVPARIGQVLGVVRTLIEYGQDLADTLNQHASVPHLLPFFSFIATIFRSKDVALILARITRGLLRAAALEQRLQNRAARGRDIQPRELRAPSPRKPHTARQPRPPILDPRRPPTLEQIAAQDRRRPIGAVLVDICLDLGIIPGQMDPASWNELGSALALYGGDLSTLVRARPVPPRPRSGRPAGSASFLPVRIPGQTGLMFPPWPAPPERPPPLTGESSREADRWGRGPGP